MEINFRLDGDGRTCFEDGESNDDTIHLDYSCKVISTGLSKEWPPPNPSSTNLISPQESLLDDLIFDCEILDLAILPRTFWISSSAKPRCLIEKCALEIFHHHVPDGYKYDVSCSGAEWWAQIRPSPPSGRYNILAQDCDRQDDMYNSGINFHWDKDEDLRLVMDGTMYIHPHISTVTYLTSIGAPTMALNYRIHPLNGTWITPEEAAETEAFISWPQCGKHFSFDGRFLHAAPSDLMEAGAFDRQIDVPPPPTMDEKEITRHKRRHRRVTFLVNIWLNHKPFNVEEFPESMINQLSKTDDTFQPVIQFKSIDSKPMVIQKIVVTSDTMSNQTFTWPMGGDASKEKVEVVLPINEIRNEMSNGGSLSITWDMLDGVRLLDGTEESIEHHIQKKTRLIE